MPSCVSQSPSSASPLAVASITPAIPFTRENNSICWSVFTSIISTSQLSWSCQATNFKQLPVPFGSTGMSLWGLPREGFLTFSLFFSISLVSSQSDCSNQHMEGPFFPVDGKWHLWCLASSWIRARSCSTVVTHLMNCTQPAWLPQCLCALDPKDHPCVWT